MADQKINALPTKATPTSGDKCLMSGAAEEYLIDYDQLATAILNKLTSKTYSLDQGTKTLIAALNELNSKSSNLTYGKNAITSIKAQAEGMSGSRSLQIFLIQNGVTTDIPMNSSGFCFIFEYGGGTGCVFTFHNNGDICVAGKSNSVLGDFRKVQIGS